MQTRRLLAFLFALLFCLGTASGALAAKEADPDAAFLKDLKSLESYLRKNADVTNLASKAEEYLYTNYPNMDMKRLGACLQRFLGCSETVSLSIKLESYAKELKNGYRSIADACKLYKITPEEASDKNFMERSSVATQMRDKDTKRKHRKGKGGTLIY